MSWIAITDRLSQPIGWEYSDDPDTDDPVCGLAAIIAEDPDNLGTHEHPEATESIYTNNHVLGIRTRVVSTDPPHTTEIYVFCRQVQTISTIPPGNSIPTVIGYGEQSKTYWDANPPV